MIQMKKFFLKRKVHVCTAGIFLLLVFCVGCSNNEASSDSAASVPMDTTEVNTKSGTITGTAGDTKSPAEEEASLPLSVSEASYHSETDDALYLSEPQIAVTSSGYYYFDDEILMYFDKEAKENVPVCTQLNCSHDSEDCDAWYDFREWRTEQGIWYRDGYLYLFGSDSSFQTYSFWRMKTDGTGLEKLSELFTVKGEDDYLSSPVIHRGYLYYSLVEETAEGSGLLYRVSLEPSEEPELVYKKQLPFASIHRLRGYGDGVFFQLGYYMGDTMEDDGDYRAAIYYINMDNQVTKVLDGPGKFYSVIENLLYYTTDTGMIRTCNWKTGEEKDFYNAGAIADISCDGNYIYLDDYYGMILDDKKDTSQRKITCLEMDGTFVTEWNVPTSESTNCIFGDENYMWMKFYDGSLSESVLKAYDKQKMSDAGDGWSRWEAAE